MNSPTSAPRKNSEAEDTWEDPVIRELREVRHRLAESFDNDLGRVSRDLIERQVDHGPRLRRDPPLQRQA